MKIALSLRLYFLSAMLMLGITIFSGFAAVTVHYYIQGMDRVMQINMISAAENSQAEDGKPDTVLDYHIATRWQDVPQSIRQFISIPPSKAFGFVKFIDDHGWFERPKGGYFVLLVPGNMGENYYVSHQFAKEQDCEVEHEGFGTFAWIGMVAGGSFMVFLLLLILMIRSIAKPVEHLGRWAKSLDAEKLKRDAPDFRYNELNRLARIIRSSLRSVQSSLQREHDFLRHASHELRTPIAVIRSNIDLLKKVIDEKVLEKSVSDKESRIVERIERAGLTMGDLTETLLWLSREQENPPLKEDVALDGLVEQILQELQYLLQGKQVEITFKSTPFTMDLPESACRMVLNNLIRNAFEHTQHGEVRINQSGPQVMIDNHNLKPIQEAQELGFGLGLQLTHKLTRRYGWSYSNQNTPHGHQVCVNFGTHTGD